MVSPASSQRGTAATKFYSPASFRSRAEHQARPPTPASNSSTSDPHIVLSPEPSQSESDTPFFDPSDLPLFKIDLCKTLPRQQPLECAIYDESDRDFFRDWINKKIEWNIIQVPSSFPLLWTNHFVLRVPGHQPKIIGNFKTLNEFSKWSHFKGPSATRIVQWAAIHPFKAKIDLRNGYCNSYVHPDTQPHH